MPSETDVKEVRSTCPYCGVGCGFILRAQNGRLVGKIGSVMHSCNSLPVRESSKRERG